MSTIPPPAPLPAAPLEQLRKAAIRYLDLAGGRPQGDELRRLLDSIADHLAQHLGVGPELAADMALRVWAEREGKWSGASFDLAASTPWLVWIDDPVAGVRRCLTAAELLRLMGPRAVPGAGGAPNPLGPLPPRPDMPADAA